MADESGESPQALDSEAAGVVDPQHPEGQDLGAGGGPKAWADSGRGGGVVNFGRTKRLRWPDSDGALQTEHTLSDGTYTSGFLGLGSVLVPPLR